MKIMNGKCFHFYSKQMKPGNVTIKFHDNGLTAKNIVNFILAIVI